MSTQSSAVELARRLLQDAAGYFETLFHRHGIGITERGIDPDKLRACASSLSPTSNDTLPKIRHRGVFVERQLQGSGIYRYICHTGISKFLPDLYETQAAAIEAIDAKFARAKASAAAVPAEVSHPASTSSEWREAMEDLYTHRSSWRSIMDNARESASSARDDMDEKGWIAHELKAFDRVMDALLPEHPLPSGEHLSALRSALEEIRDAEPPEGGLMRGVDIWQAFSEELQKRAADALPAPALSKHNQFNPQREYPGSYGSAAESSR